MTDKLDKLFVSNDTLNSDMLYELLEGRVKLTEDSDILIMGNFDPSKVIVLYCLAKKVLFIKKKVEAELSGPKDISTKTGLKEGTVKVYVRQLEQKNLLVNKGGTYYVPNFLLPMVKVYLQNE